jgi:hypothetical protein
MADKYVYTGEEIRSIRAILQMILTQVEQAVPLAGSSVVSASVSEINNILSRGLNRKSLTYIENVKNPL